MKLNFFYREECHLCDAMRKALVAFDRDVHPVEWQAVDIDRDQQLKVLYDARVPVLSLGDEEICHFFFDEQALLAILNENHGRAE